MLASIAIFTLTEIILGHIVADLILGSYLSIPGRFRIQVILHLASFFVGGFIVGLVSPGMRIMEPALGAFLAVAGVTLFSLFIPLSFFRFDTWKTLIAGLIAFGLAITGAKLGERLTGQWSDDE